MSDGTQLAEIAAEVHGNDFHGIAPRPSKAPERPHYTGERQALEAVDAAREDKQRRQIAASEEPETEAADDAAPRWSDADIRDLTYFQNTAQHQAASAQSFAARYQRSLRDAGARSFEELQRYDPAEAAALQQEFAPIWEGAQQVQAMHQTITANLHERALHAAASKLHKDLPDLEANKGAFVSWCLDQGYTREQVLGETNPEVIKLAYRAFQSENRQTARAKQPKFRRTPRRQPEPGPEQTAMNRLQQTGKIDDALAVITARRQRSRA